ncbi:MAG: hypothetical protein BRD46_04385, partial [Bacteroidetes bacterium QS_8_68_15]
MAEDASSPTTEQPRPDTAEDDASPEDGASAEDENAPTEQAASAPAEEAPSEDPGPAGEATEAQQHPDESGGAAVTDQASAGEGAPDTPAASASGDGAVMDAGEEDVAMTEEESTPTDAVPEDAEDDEESGAETPSAEDEEASSPADEGDDQQSGPVKRMLEEAVENVSSEGDGIPSSDDVSLPTPGGEEGSVSEEGAVSSEELQEQSRSEDAGFTGEAIGRTVSLEDLERETAAEQRAADESYARLRNLIDETTTELYEQEIVPGRVLSADASDVLIDIGYKSDGVVDRAEFGDRKLSPGDEVEVWLDFKEDRDGQLVISKERADRERRWQRVEKIHENDEVIEGQITERIKGGMIAEILDGEMEAFLPGSQIDVRRVRDFEQYLGRRMEFKIVKLNPGNENIVISHRVLIEKELEEQREEILSSLEVGQVLQGQVKNIVDFGAFVDLGGVDGLLHITDLSWGRVSHP